MKKILFVAIVALIFASCTGKKSSVKNTEITNETGQIVKPLDSVTQIIGLGRIEPEKRITPLAAETGGIVTNINKNEGDTVKSGEVIIELEHSVESAKVSQALSRLKTQEAQIASDEAAVKEYAVKLQNKNKELVRLQNLLNSGAETQQVVDDAQTEVKTLQASVDKLQALLNASKAKLAELESDLKIATNELNLRFIKAPSDGSIITMDAHVGGAVGTQQQFAEFVPAGKIVATCEIDELFANKIILGQKASIRLVGSNTIIGTGKVVYSASSLKKKSLFSDNAGDQEDRRVREIKILLDKQSGYLINSRIECIVDVI